METTVPEHPDENAGFPGSPNGRVLGTVTVMWMMLVVSSPTTATPHGVVARHRVRTDFFKRRGRIL
jgi:hypothetical protein